MREDRWRGSRKRWVLAAATLAAAACACRASEKGMRVVKTDEGYQFYEGEAPVLFYRTAPKSTAKGTHSRANYCHPVYGLDGKVMSEDFPRDHLHHRGIFWAWHQVSVGDTQIHDMWDCNNFTWDFRKVRILDAGKDAAALRAEVHWKSPQWKEGRQAFAKETVTIRVHKLSGGARLVDFSIDILALEPGLRIGGSNNDKGYGGFSTRIILPKGMQLNDAEGPVVPKRRAVAAGDWMNITAKFGEKESGFAIFVAPSHPGSPRRWILRKALSAQNLAYPGREPVPVSTEKPLALGYRLVFHRDADLDKLFKDYCAEVK